MAVQTSTAHAGAHADVSRSLLTREHVPEYAASPSVGSGGTVPVAYSQCNGPSAVALRRHPLPQPLIRQRRQAR